MKLDAVQIDLRRRERSIAVDGFVQRNRRSPRRHSSSSREIVRFAVASAVMALVVVAHRSWDAKCCGRPLRDCLRPLCNCNSGRSGCLRDRPASSSSPVHVTTVPPLIVDRLRLGCLVPASNRESAAYRADKHMAPSRRRQSRIWWNRVHSGEVLAEKGFRSQRLSALHLAGFIPVSVFRKAICYHAPSTCNDVAGCQRKTGGPKPACSFPAS